MPSNNQNQFSENQIVGLKVDLNQIAQGCVTLIKVLSMAQIPDRDKFPDGRPNGQATPQQLGRIRK